ncbi:MAG: DUF4384 domain-containing protein [Calditrichota bacterium]
MFRNPHHQEHKEHKEYFTIILLGVLCVLCGKVSFAGEWFNGEGIVTISHISPEEAKRQAFELARNDALSKAGIEITGAAGSAVSEGRDYYDSFIRFTLTRTRGLIVNVDTLFAGLEMPSPGGGRPIPIYRAAIRAEVVNQIGEPDPGFKVMLTLNREVYRSGEPMTVSLQATRDCYVLLLNLYSNDSMRVVLPSFMQEDNHLGLNQILTMPSPGYEMPVSLLPERDEDTETILAIATRELIPFIGGQTTTQEGLTAQSEALIALSCWLADIPCDQRAEAWAFYRVVK